MRRLTNGGEFSAFRAFAAVSHSMPFRLGRISEITAHPLICEGWAGGWCCFDSVEVPQKRPEHEGQRRMALHRALCVLDKDESICT
jgi:hypothetical protein